MKNMGGKTSSLILLTDRFGQFSATTGGIVKLTDGIVIQSNDDDNFIHPAPFSSGTDHPLCVAVLPAAIGKELARCFDNMRNESRVSAFELIEEGMNSSDHALKTAVATGIIEALISESSRNEGLWSRIELQLGSVSRRHADGWRNTLLQQY